MLERVPHTVEEILEEFLKDPARSRFAGAREVVSWREDDDRDWARALAARGAAAVELHRRGRHHGRVAVLGAPQRWPRPSQCRHLWARARPFVLSRALGDALSRWRNEIHQGLLRAEELTKGNSLGAVLRRALAGRNGRFSVLGPLPLLDPERDLECVELREVAAPGRRLWAKSARLSTHPGDRSLRLRFGQGQEGDEDDSDDEAGWRALAALARAALAEAAPVEGAKDLWRQVAEAAGEPLYPTGAIVYWNAPEGGARLHHDAFRPDDSGGQRGVLYTQLAGRTFWLALSSADLARRTREFADVVAQGELPWLAEELPPGTLDALARLAEDPAGLAAELALPGQGQLGPLLDRGPEFTLFLVDSGHGALLEAGDAIALPNHGLERTALHSVFCASPGPTLALSFGLRSARPTRPHPRAPAC